MFGWIHGSQTSVSKEVKGCLIKPLDLQFYFSCPQALLHSIQVTFRYCAVQTAQFLWLLRHVELDHKEDSNVYQSRLGPARGAKSTDNEYCRGLGRL